MTESSDDKSSDQRSPPSPVWKQLNQKDRLAALAQIEFPDTGSDSPFLALVIKATALFDAPLAKVNLLNCEHQITQCAHGSQLNTIGVEDAFCAHAIAEATPATVVLDAQREPRFEGYPQLAPPAQIRFYIGCPIRFRGHKVGTLCVFDSEPREGMTAAQKRMLIELAWDAEQIIDDGRNLGD